MAGRIIYLEVDDEITSAAARIRDAEAPRIAVVLPYGSRVATSRINFRLLSRDALTHDKRLSIVAGRCRRRGRSRRRPACRSSLGRRVRVVARRARRRAPTRDRRPPAAAAAVAAASRRAAATGRAHADRAAGSDGTLGLVVPAAGASGAAGPAAPSADRAVAATPSARPCPAASRPRDPHPVDAGPGRRRSARPGRADAARWRRRPPDAVARSAAAILGPGRARRRRSAPTCSCRRRRSSVTPRPEPVGPIDLTVVADPTATAARRRRLRRPGQAGPDPGRGQRHVQRDRQAGRADQRDRARSASRTSTRRAPTGSPRGASSAPPPASGSGPTSTVTVPRAELVGLTIFPARASVKVTAVDGGPDGNVEPARS